MFGWFDKTTSELKRIECKVDVQSAKLDAILTALHQGTNLSPADAAALATATADLKAQTAALQTAVDANQTRPF